MVPKLELPPSLNIPDLMQFRRAVTVRHGFDELHTGQQCPDDIK